MGMASHRFASEGQWHFNDYVINVLYDPYALNGRAYSILFSF